LRDAGLGVTAILTVQRCQDIVWFWCIHFCLDMSRFASLLGAG